VSTLVPKGLHGIPQPVYLSLPCVLNRGQTVCLPVLRYTDVPDVL
jgi:hypothetical protein